jgi:hypothetical protein
MKVLLKEGEVDGKKNRIGCDFSFGGASLHDAPIQTLNTQHSTLNVQCSMSL